MVQKVVKRRAMISVGIQGCAVALGTWFPSIFIGHQLWSEQAYENVANTATYHARFDPMDNNKGPMYSAWPQDLPSSTIGPQGHQKLRSCSSSVEAPVTFFHSSPDNDTRANKKPEYVAAAIMPLPSNPTAENALAKNSASSVCPSHSTSWP